MKTVWTDFLFLVKLFGPAALGFVGALGFYLYDQILIAVLAGLFGLIWLGLVIRGLYSLSHSGGMWLGDDDD